MPTGTNVRTYFRGAWHDGDLAVMNAADHGMWLGSAVFDGARAFEGRVPDLGPHCARAVASARAMGLNPVQTAAQIEALVREGLTGCTPGAAVYIRPMFWGVATGYMAVEPDHDAPAGFAICLEELPMPAADAALTLCRTRFRRPVIEDAVVGAKAACLYPNNARMLTEARARGFGNALAADAIGNVAESATSNVFLSLDGAVVTPVPNGTFLAGITRARTIALLREAGHEVIERTVTFADVEAAAEVFLTGNAAKITPVTAFEDTRYQIGPVTRAAREAYFDWAARD
ncbi:MAG: branched-chain amino acid aminotransferase [Paracoccaceae bacterium]